MRSNQIERELKVRFYLSIGVPKSIIGDYMGMTKKQITLVVSELSADGIEYGNKIRKFRSPGSVMRTRKVSIEASLWATLYLKLVGADEIYQALDLKKFVESYSLYIDYRVEVGLLAVDKLSIPEMLCFAEALVEKEALITYCKECGTATYLLTNQRFDETCPACYLDDCA
jgi:hypothetical protein